MSSRYFRDCWLNSREDLIGGINRLTRGVSMARKKLLLVEEKREREEREEKQTSV